MKDSEQISGFLEFLRNCDAELSIAYSIQRDMDAATQDILHNLEMQENSQFDFILQGIALQDIRRKRRRAKDRERILTPIVEWYAANKRVINELERLLGRIRKEESAITNRSYMNRTDIIQNILQKEEV